MSECGHDAYDSKMRFCPLAVQSGNTCSEVEVVKRYGSGKCDSCLAAGKG